MRLECTPLFEEKASLNQIYSEQQHHKSIIEYLDHKFQEASCIKGLLLQVMLATTTVAALFYIFLQVTTRSHLLSQDSLMQIQVVLGLEVYPFFLHEFDTELDFSNKIG